ncbi:hypothetical protein Tco_1298377, partial [Tanacetum coccineum]
WGDAKVAEEFHHLSSLLLERVLSHTIAPAAEGAMILLPTPDEIVASLSDPRLAKKSKGPSQRKLKKRASEAGSSAPELGQAEGMNEVDLTDLCSKIENSLERDEGTSTRAASAPTPRLGNRLGAPFSVAVVSVSGSSFVGTLVYASTSRRSTVVSGHTGKSEAEVVRCQMDPLDSLARSALARYVEYDQILEDDFGTATCDEDIDLTLFPLTLGPYQMSYLYEDPNICRKALDRTLTPAELKRSKSLLLLDLSNHFNVLSALLVSHGAELNSCYTGLVTARNRLWEKFDRKAGYVKVLRSEVTTLDGKLKRIQKDCDALGLSDELSKTDAKLSDQALIMRDLQNQLALEKAKSQEYKDVVDGLREEVTRFVGSSVESHVASLSINYGFKRGLRMGCIDTEFEVVAQKVSNFHVGAKADFDKDLVDFPTTPFPFLGKIVAAAVGTLLEVTQVLPNKYIRSVTYVPVALSIANENVN